MSSPDADVEGAVLFVVGCFGLALLTVSLLFALPVIVVGFGGWALYRWRTSSPAVLERREREHIESLYNEARRITPDTLSKQEFGTHVYEALSPLPDALENAFIAVALDLYDAEEFAEPLQKPPPICNSMEGARYKDYLSARTAKIADIASTIDALTAITLSYKQFIRHLPPLSDDDGTFTVPLIDLLDEPGEAITDLITPFFFRQTGPLFMDMCLKLEENVHEVSGIPFTRENRNHPKLVYPKDYEGESIAYAYLKDTPLLDIVDAHIPFSIPPTTRFEHHWICSPPGGGKSTMLQCLLMDDFERVARNEASVVVIDSNRDLAKSIERLKRFGKGGDLEGRLIVIDVEDVEYPVAINIFDTQTDDAALSPRDREVLYNSAVSMLTYIFDALLGAEMTSRQNTLFNFTIELLLALEEPTLDTLIDLMQPDGLVKFAEHIPKLSPDARRFFELKFNAKEFTATKSQVVDRLFAVKRIRALARIFSSPKTKLDLFEELSKSRVIVINAAKSVLQEDGVEIFTRFFLANIMLAAEKRQLLPKTERQDTYLYVDEAQDVCRRDQRLPVVLDQARKLRLGCIIAHQRLGQMTPQVLNALMGSTAIKFAANLGDSSLGALATTMNTTTDFLRHQPPFHFAAYIRGTTETAISLKVPHVDFSKMEQMTEVDRAEVRRVMRERYATRYAADVPSIHRGDEEDGSGAQRSDEPSDLDNPHWE